MDIKTLIVIDADQYPLEKLSLPSKDSISLLAASNNANHLQDAVQKTSLLVPNVPEAADTYLIIYLYKLLKENNIENVMLVSSDKKLIYMAIVTCSLFNTGVELHPSAITRLGRNFTHSCLAMCRKLNIRFEHNQNKQFLSICNHLRKYKLGLKISTLAYHLSLSYNDAIALVETLVEQHQVVKCGRAYIYRKK